MDYRAYILDDEGRITGMHELDCANDEEAKEKGHDLDVWRRERHVTRLKRHTRQ